MTGIVVLLLAVAIPLGIVVFAVMTTVAERKVFEHAPVSKFSAGVLFGLAAVLGVIWVFRGTGPEYASAIAALLSIPAAAIAALLALASHRFLVGRSKFITVNRGQTTFSDIVRQHFSFKLRSRHAASRSIDLA